MWCLAAALGSAKAPTTSGEARRTAPPCDSQCFAHLPPLFRMTILPPMEKLRPLLEKLSQFHTKFTREYS